MGRAGKIPAQNPRGGILLRVFCSEKFFLRRIFAHMPCGLRRTGGALRRSRREIPPAAGLFRRAAVFPAERKIRFLQLCGTL
ncbi:MAG: hypothetical protein DBY30_06250 [Verrucomicrobia bacterium]|nr:MAG: hypothetical protein DBY30_06250 [Verrucomicrobiota bacterium]